MADHRPIAPKRVLRYPKWQPQYEALLREKDVDSLKHRITELEAAIFDRLQEIGGRSDCQEERTALRAVTERVREIQVTRLGFPAIEPLNHGASEKA